METDKRRFVNSSSADVDIITNFPEDLINPILERLPVKDAVRTSILSKKWRYKWTTMTTLDLHSNFSNQFLNIGPYQHNGLIRVINNIMIYHKGPILNFFLYIPKKIILDTFQELDQWMFILSKNNVRTLDLRNSNQLYQIPSTVFSCLELTMLSLGSCIFNPSPEFKGFPNLKYMFFKRVHFGGNLSGVEIKLPKLESLTLYGCANVNNFNIKAEKLRTLLVDCYPEAMLTRLLCSEHLLAVKICLSESLYDFAHAKRFSFTIDGLFLKFFAAARFSEWLPHAIKWVTRLNFKGFCFGDMDQVQGALCMLRNSPNLQVLCVTLVQMGPEDGLELTSNYLESHDGLDQTLSMLRTVRMTSLEGSRPELLFVKLLLNHSPHLENMIIRSAATADAQKRVNLAKEVMMFPRASTKAKMVYLNPLP